MTQRDLAARHKVDNDRPDSPHAHIWTLTITHPGLSVPIRVAGDYFAYEIGGEVYQPAPFSAQPLSDNDQAPSAEIRVQNVDRLIGQALERDVSGSRAIVHAVAYSSADFDLSVDPRVPLDVNDLPPIYKYEFLELTDVQINAVELVGRVSLIDVMQEPWPFLRATSDIFPGLFV